MKQKSLLVILACLMVLTLAACASSQATEDSSMVNTVVAQNIELTQQAATILAANATQTALYNATQTAAAAPTNTATVAPTQAPVVVVTTKPVVQPTVAAAATATPNYGFTLAYNSLTSCNEMYSVVVRATNTGPTTWESYKLTVTDTQTGTSFTTMGSSFPLYSICAISNTQEELSTSEYADIATDFDNRFSYNLSGHKLNVTVTLYTANGQSGDSQTRTLTVTP